MEIGKQEKVKKILTRVWLGVTTFLSGLFVVAVAVGCSQKGNKQASAYYDDSEYEYSYRYDYHKEYRNPQKAVVFNDDDYEITLSADELNNYTWDNLYSYFRNDYVSNASFSETFITFNELIYSLDEIYIEPDERLYITYQKSQTYDYIEFCQISDYKSGNNIFVHYDGSSEENLGFDYSIIWTLTEYVYSDIQSAIQADIQANSTNPGTDFVNDIFTDMTKAIVGFTGSVGSGIVAMTALFYDSVNSQLTPLGLLSVIVVAVSLAYWLFRLIIGLIRMRG